MADRNLSFVPIAGDYTVLRNRASNPHLHLVYHLIIITSGKGVLDKGETQLDLQEGDILFINPGEPHIFRPAQGGEMIFFSLNFYLLDLNTIGEIAELNAKLNNIDYFENHAVTTPFELLFHVVEAAGKISYDHSKWHTLMLTVTEIDDYYVRYSKRSPLTQEETVYLQHEIINFTFRRFLLLLDYFHQQDAVNLTQKERRLAQNIIDYLGENYSKPLNLQDMAAALSYSPVYLCRYFKEKTGFTISDYLNRLRINKGCGYLKGADHSISRIAELLGFCSPNHFSKNFKKAMGVSPREYRMMKG